MYREMYAVLFRAVTEALEQMDGGNYGVARGILVLAQQNTEEIFMGGEEDGDETGGA